MLRTGAVLLSVTLVACARTSAPLIASHGAPPTQEQPSSAVAPAPEPRDDLAPASSDVAAPEPFVALAVGGFGDAVLGVPATLDRRWPVLIATHGAGDTPEWQCEIWQKRIGRRAFILCPRGVRLTADPRVPSGYFYRNHFELEKEVLAAVAALEQAYSGTADTTAMVYTGYSQGATMGSLMLPAHAARFPRLILVEGGTREWHRKSARSYREHGGARVLFACGTAHCTRGAEQSAALLRRAEVEVRVEHAIGAGHIYDGAVGERVAEHFGWLTEGDPRWNH